MSNSVARGAFTSVVTIDAGAAGKIRCVLQAIGDDVDGNGFLDFTGLRLTHFVRWVVLSLPGVDYLVLESNFDPPLALHVEELVAMGPATLATLYAQCGFAGGNHKRALVSYIMGHAVDCSAFYRAYPYAVETIRNDARLRDEALRWRRANPGVVADPVHACALLRQTLFQQGFDLRSDPASPPQLADRLATGIMDPGPLNAAAKVAALGLALPLLPVMRAIETCEGGYTKERDLVPKNLREDVQGQNQLSHVVALKKTPLRKPFLRIVLRAIDTVAEHYYTHGTLGGISAIHFARWIVLDERWLVFFANYDGSWEHYLGDFIDLAAEALTGVWGNTEGFPETRFFVGEGAKDEEGFKQWSREHQVPSQVWYSAYVDLSVQNILHNAKLRNELRPQMSPAEARSWLELL